MDWIWQNYSEENLINSLYYFNINNYMFKYYPSVLVLFNYDSINNILLDKNDIITSFTFSNNKVFFYVHFYQ